MRILVTGSRDWDDEERLRDILTQMKLNPKTTVLVSGNCPTGADLMCEDFAIEHGWEVERHPANWEKHGKRAGFIRNFDMVSLGADICLAFIKNDSKGATMTLELARKADIQSYKIVPRPINEVTRQRV